MQGDGTLVSKNTYKTGNHPTAIAIDPQGKFLYVTFTYQIRHVRPGRRLYLSGERGQLAGTASTSTVGTNPVGVSRQLLQSLCLRAGPGASPTPQILGFSQNTSTGALTPVPGTTITTVGLARWPRDIPPA